jgi:AcrR family transcriptional regulator
MKSANHLIRPARAPEPEPEPGASAMPEGLRERKRRLTREAIFAAAGRLFAARGFENVTVAEIADAANVSVKTVFTYVSAKEELLFGGRPTVLDAVVRAVANRRLGQTPLVAAAQALLAAVNERDENLSLEAFQRMISSGPAARSLARARWEETETQLAEVLLAEVPTAQAGSVAERAARRLTAAQIMVLVRTVSSEEVADLITKSADTDAARREALSSWIRDAAGRLARGLQSAPR